MARISWSTRVQPGWTFHAQVGLYFPKIGRMKNRNESFNDGRDPYGWLGGAGERAEGLTS